MLEIATRDAFGEALLSAGASNERVVVVSCDLSSATRALAFGQKYPDRFFEVGIAEQNGLGVAAGLALEGLRPFVSSFGAFITARYDQIKTSCAYNKAGVVIVGSHSGLAIGKDGGTQMGIEDINLMAGVPNMEIFQPADGLEAKQIVEYLVNTNGLAYLRLSRTPHEAVFSDTYQFEFNKGVVLREGSSVVILATGDTVYNAIKSTDLLNKEGYNPTVVSFSTIKPIDRQLIIDLSRENNVFVTVEDHNTVGGLGTRVAEVIAEEGLNVTLKRIGISDCFGESGSPDDLYRKFGLDVKGITDAVAKFAEEMKLSKEALIKSSASKSVATV